MTAEQMRYEFKVIYELDNMMSPGLNDRQISTFLTDAQLSFIKSHYNFLGNKYQKGFEGMEKRRKDLSSLVSNVSIPYTSFSTSSFNKPNAVTVDMSSLTNEMMYVINEELTTNIRLSDCIRVSTAVALTNTNLYRRIPVLPKTHDEYNINIDNPFKKPNDNNAWRLDIGHSEHEIITDGTYSPVVYYCRYIKYPRPIIVPSSRTFTIDGITNTLNTGLDCELDESTHREIVKMAVSIATSITNQNEYSIKQNEVNKSE